ncbi:hypothetical protein EYF80_014787 [Liparis tanakae]|uniref:Uncharacterized protein n=1 Tax=Liparis tanakae TaxID=230148 RepID=A0A4Z2IBF7_9TELE|nr:hypothetical protein EYF80_014787 [Liparis tanakae]
MVTHRTAVSVQENLKDDGMEKKKKKKQHMAPLTPGAVLGPIWCCWTGQTSAAVNHGREEQSHSVQKRWTVPYPPAEDKGRAPPKQEEKQSDIEKARDWISGEERMEGWMDGGMEGWTDGGVEVYGEPKESRRNVRRVRRGRLPAA